MRKVKIAGIAILLFTVLAFVISWTSGISPLAFGMHHSVFESSGYAIGGYDVVSYFKNEPTKGNESYSIEYDEVKWLFSSELNKNEFQSNPEKFIPQYGGYCTYSVSKGFAAPSDPNYWLIKDEKLYYFSSEKTKKNFIANSTELIDACEKGWD